MWSFDPRCMHPTVLQSTSSYPSSTSRSFPKRDRHCHNPPMRPRARTGIPPRDSRTTSRKAQRGHCWTRPPVPRNSRSIRKRRPRSPQARCTLADSERATSLVSSTRCVDLRTTRSNGPLHIELNKETSRPPSCARKRAGYSSSARRSSRVTALAWVPAAPSATLARPRFFSCRAKMRSSTVSLTTIRYTMTGRSCPMRCARSAA